MASLATRLTDLATRIATELKAHKTFINGNAADLTSLTTTNKTNLIAAINEVKALAGASSSISDGSTATGTTWSSQKINDYVATQFTALLGGAAAAYDTLAELQAQLQSDDTDISGLLTAVGNRLRFDAVQNLSAVQKTQACSNLGIGEPDTDFVSTFNTGLV